MSGNEIVALTGDVVKVGMSHPEPEHTKQFMLINLTLSTIYNSPSVC